jgi:hypothetical protein
MRHNQETKPDPNRKPLVFWNSAVDSIEQLLVLVFNCLSSDVALGGAGQRTALNDNDVFRGGNALVHIAARVEMLRFLDYFLLELLGVHGALVRDLDE